MNNEKINQASKIPVLIIIFNRKQKVQELINSLRQIKPKNIFVAADGPRPNNSEDKEKCIECRDVLKEIDWECEIHTKFSDENLGLSINMEEAIDWFFENVEMGIVLEDDCIPNQDFFVFVEELLNKYKNEEQIMLISGTNFHGKENLKGASYYFSNYANIWGWATWKRAWKHYDKGTKHLDEFLSKNKLSEVFPDKKQQEFWTKSFTNTHKDKFGNDRLTWATTWTYSVFRQKGISIVPNVNLVQNIGYGEDSTHTAGSGRTWSIKTQELKEIIHPEKIAVDKKADYKHFKKNHYKNCWDKFYNWLNVTLDKLHIKPQLVKFLRKIKLYK